MKAKHAPSTLSQLLVLPFILAAVVLLIIGLLQYKDNRYVADIATEKATIERYAIQCYASEGSYPPDLTYLEDNYGLILKRERYLYYYEVFASNVLPDIRVIPLNPLPVKDGGAQ